MPILDKSKIRPDILKFMEDVERVRALAIAEFFKIKENKGVDFQSLWSKVIQGNERALKGEDMQNYLNKEEQLFLAKFHRFSFEFRASYMQKNVFPTALDNVKLEQVRVNDVNAEWQNVPEARKEHILFYLHGGGWIMGSPNTHRLFTIILSRVTKMRVFSVDYRLAPEHPYPAALEDCTTTYNWLLSQEIKSENIILAGDSAGGYLTLMTLVKLRNKGLPLPAGAVCLSPATDLAITGQSNFKNAPTDPILADLGTFWWSLAYLAGADPKSPIVSPLYADLTGLPPILIQVSTSEMLYDDSTRFAKRARSAGVDVTLQTWNDTLHVFPAYGLPESEEAISKIAEFVQKQLSTK
ncbi:MAG: alpha/beta hydrolase [Promethearchaeota archaeon]